MQHHIHASPTSSQAFALQIRARRSDDLLSLAFAGVIGGALTRGRRPMIRGLSESRFQKLLNEYFVDAELDNGEPGQDSAIAAGEEFLDLVDLLLEHRATPGERAAWLCYAIATAAMGENHLWQDMGLPDRKTLSALMCESFPALTAKNSGDMKWKKFFYRHLCERAEVPICKSPHCAECSDYVFCFSHES
ncbi:MAG: nitrogen fixation protein NifQ [Sulfurisoma sp.]|nr:nitrogen fixation protein NifQ [Sulfurisoma sp.]